MPRRQPAGRKHLEFAGNDEKSARVSAGASGPFREGVAATYDESCRDMFTPEVLRATVDVLAELAGTGAALEFAIGTGRVRLPLADRGVPVSGIELSTAMVDRLRTKDVSHRVKVTLGDMVTTRAGDNLGWCTWCSTPSEI